MKQGNVRNGLTSVLCSFDSDSPGICLVCECGHSEGTTITERIGRNRNEDKNRNRIKIKTRKSF